MEEGKENGENFAELLAQHELDSNRLQVGQKISGTVIAITGDSVFVDIGEKQDGVLDKAEILDGDGNETLKVGDTIETRLVSLSSQGIRLSRSMIGAGVEALEQAKEAQIPVKGRVKADCKGGYQVDVLGKVAFCPGSQMESADGARGADLIGREMEFLISRVENHGRNIVVSRRALLDKERKENLDKLLQNLKVEDIMEGTVTRLAPFGAFVELAPAVEGLVHISELGWSRVKSPDEAVSIGEKVRVKVTAIDQGDKGRISLSIKQAATDPWNDVPDRFITGEVVKGKVRRLAPFGAFVEIAPGIEGLIHLSEFSWEKRITRPEDMLSVGDELNVKIKDINPENRRISLSLRDAGGNPWDDLSEAFTTGAIVSGTVVQTSPHGVFVQLAPGITGLIPKSSLASAPKIGKLPEGSEIKVQIRAVDKDAHRIGLAPVVETVQEEPAEKDWRNHVRKEPKDLGIMAQALQKAFQKK